MKRFFIYFILSFFLLLVSAFLTGLLNVYAEKGHIDLSEAVAIFGRSLAASAVLSLVLSAFFRWFGGSVTKK